MIHHHLPDELDWKIKDLQKIAKKVQENDALLTRLLKGEHVEARVAAERRATRLEEENDALQRANKQLLTRCSNLGNTAQGLRRALHGAGCGDLPTHARAVFAALAEAAPDHPLVKDST